VKTSSGSALLTVSAKRVDRPKLWIVAGPNGSGKSSLYSNGDIEDFGGSVWIINPDLLSARIEQVEKLDLRAANLEAVKRIYSWLEASIAAHQTVGVETVLSTDKYRQLVLSAKARSFEVRLIYVLLRSAELNIERVKMRVAKGGHDVPENKIIERRQRSLAQLPWFLDQADQAWLYDNSDASPRLMGTKNNGVIELDRAALPEIARAVDLIRTE
jgi:predicted ABC-type ATPase